MEGVVSKANERSSFVTASPKGHNVQDHGDDCWERVCMFIFAGCLCVKSKDCCGAPLNGRVEKGSWRAGSMLTERDVFLVMCCPCACCSWCLSSDIQSNPTGGQYINSYTHKYQSYVEIHGCTCCPETYTWKVLTPPVETQPYHCKPCCNFGPWYVSGM